MRVVDLWSPLRTPPNILINQWKHWLITLRRIPTSGEQICHNSKTPERRSCELTRTVDLGMLQDLPWLLELDRGQPNANDTKSKGKVTQRIPLNVEVMK